jgi:hypothetical protein
VPALKGQTLTIRFLILAAFLAFAALIACMIAWEIVRSWIWQRGRLSSTRQRGFQVELPAKSGPENKPGGPAAS